jgi:hypothetical protein
MSDQVNARIVFTPWVVLMHSWMAFALADGSTDGVLYPSKTEAARHQSNEHLYCYFTFKTAAGGISARDAEIYLAFYRNAYDHGMQMADPQAPQFIMPLAKGVPYGG